MDDERKYDGRHVLAIKDQLREAILRGEISPDTDTTQVQLAEMLGVGRTPLREALRMLQGEGLVVVEPKRRRRVRIAQTSITDLEEIYYLRVVLEVALIRVTVPNLTHKDHAELEGLLAEVGHLWAGRDQRALEGPHLSFHGRLFAGLGPRGSEVVGQLYDHSVRYRRLYVADEEWTIFQDEHRQILDAVEAGDTEKAASLQASHSLRRAFLVASRAAAGERLPKLEQLIGSLGLNLADISAGHPAYRR
jgi:DNA-binding GntR family transcriptional regulator